MKTIFMLVAVVAAAALTVSAYVCPSPQSIAHSCQQLNVSPLVCYDPKRNTKECNEKQCNQPYIDDYASCQCRSSVSQFYESSKKVEDLIRRCGGGFSNPFGDSSRYRPGQGTTMFFATTTGIRSSSSSVTKTTTRTKTSSRTTTAQPILEPTSTPTPSLVTTQSRHISKGAIAGIVLGLLASTLVACLLGFCWRQKRADHVAAVNKIHIPHRPTRTTVTEKIEPVMVKVDSGDQTYHTTTTTSAPSDAAAGTGTTDTASRSNYVGSTHGYNTQPRR
ncbi:hypothetical protein EDD11_007370 [Mortierella claussenii]|nr:hypothetical protein EDD11_007370 [Mortierella claussenii]